MANTPAQRSSPPGDRLGRYQPLLEVCKDPLGSLWLSSIASGKDEGKRVLVRRVAPTETIDATLVRETCEYAFVVMEVRHESILGLSDVVIDKGHLGATCELVEALTLMAMLQAARDRKVSIPLPAALRITTDVLHAFSAVHAFAAEQEDDPPPVHGGFNPYRVLVTSKGQVLLADIELLAPKLFAAARALDPSLAGFAAPEHATETSVLDARTDVYQVGALLWEMLSGKPLPSTVPAPRLEGVPEPVADLVVRAMAVHQDARFPSATAMANAISEAIFAAPEVSIATPRDFGRFVSELLGAQFELQRKEIASLDEPKPTLAAAGGVVRPGAKPVPSTGKVASPPRPSGGRPTDPPKGLTPRPGGFAARLAERSGRKDSVGETPAPVSARSLDAKVTAGVEPAAPPADGPAEDKAVAASPARPSEHKAPEKVPESKPADSLEAETLKHPSAAPGPGMHVAGTGSDSNGVKEIPPPARAQVKTLEFEDGEMVEEPPAPAARRASPPPALEVGKPPASAAAPVPEPARAALQTEDLELLAPPTSRKKMFAIVGGVMGLALLIVLIAIASGGSRKGGAPATREGTPAETATRTGQPSAVAEPAMTAAASAAPSETAAATASAAPAESTKAPATASPGETAAATSTVTATATAHATAKPYVAPPTGAAPPTKKPKYTPKGI